MRRSSSCPNLQNRSLMADRRSASVDVVWAIHPSVPGIWHPTVNGYSASSLLMPDYGHIRDMVIRRAHSELRLEGYRSLDATPRRIVHSQFLFRSYTVPSLQKWYQLGWWNPFYDPHECGSVWIGDWLEPEDDGYDIDDGYDGYDDDGDDSADDGWNDVVWSPNDAAQAA